MTEVAVLVVNVAVTPLNFTAVTPVRFVPVIVTLVPTGPLVGVNDVIVGPATTVKLVELFADHHRWSSRAADPSWRRSEPLR